MFIAPQFIIAKSCEQPMSVSRDGCVRKMDFHTRVYYSTLYKDQPESSTGKQMFS